jgi:cytidyltransferase-like protein
MKVAVIVSGYFDPIHQGHLDYVEFAAKHGDVFAIVNSDRQAKEKKGRHFQDEGTRRRIVGNLRNVKNAVVSESPDQTVCHDIAELVPSLEHLGYGHVMFANGGDVQEDLQAPEADTCRYLRVSRLYDTTGKKDSSRDVLQDWYEWRQKEKP